MVEESGIDGERNGRRRGIRWNGEEIRNKRDWIVKEGGIKQGLEGIRRRE